MSTDFHFSHSAPVSAPMTEIETVRKQRDDLLVSLRQAATNATPGPWSAAHWTCHATTTVMRSGTTSAIAETTGFGRDATECAKDAAFIAAANPAAVLELVSEVEHLRAAAAAPAVASGWKLVPIEPTEDMVVHGFESAPDPFFSDPEVWDKYQEMTGCQKSVFRARLCWAAMLAAAPASPAAPVARADGIIGMNGYGGTITAACTCPSGDGSLRWPCPEHSPAATPPAAADAAGMSPLEILQRCIEDEKRSWSNEDRNAIDFALGSLLSRFKVQTERMTPDTPAATSAVGQSLLRPAISAANPLPPGCYCKPGQCAAPRIMGQQTPCRDPAKRDSPAAKGAPTQEGDAA